MTEKKTEKKGKEKTNNKTVNILAEQGMLLKPGTGKWDRYTGFYRVTLQNTLNCATFNTNLKISLS